MGGVFGSATKPFGVAMVRERYSGVLFRKDSPCEVSLSENCVCVLRARRTGVGVQCCFAVIPLRLLRPIFPFS